jgi:EpsD family peptidyl-prolyl cis-trans isomerase
LGAGAAKLWPLLRPELIVLCSAVAAGCGVSEGGVAPQIAARVNAEAVTVQEVELARKRGDTLERLIDQRLARQQAIERGLDRAPPIVQAMEAARSEILARAWRQLLAEAQPRPTREEIAAYYAAHPELFAERRIYSLEEVRLARARELAAGLRSRAAKGEPLEALARWLESREARFTINRFTRGADELPLELLPRLAAMKEGEVHLVDYGSDGVVMLRLAAARHAPLEEAAAAPLIENFLAARRSSDALAREMQRLRAQARIEYFADRK